MFIYQKPEFYYLHIDHLGSGSAVTDGKGDRYKNGDTKKPHIFSIELNNKCLMIVVLYISNIILNR